MKITSLTVEGVGKFGTLTRIDGLGPGVNVLSASNEAGKSTLFRAMRVCLFERHSAKSRDITNLSTDGLSLPVTVTLGFEHAEQAYTLRKSFIKSPRGSLKREGTEIARDREADEMTWELLGIRPGSGRSVDEAALGILWVGQGQSSQVPRPTEAATSLLNAAIQQEVGTLVGGERAREVLASLREELADLVTSTGKAKTSGPFAEASRREKQLQENFDAEAQRLSHLDDQFGNVDKKRNERARLSDPAHIGRLATELEQARQNLKAGEETAALVRQFEAAEQTAAAVLDTRKQYLERIRERAKQIDSDRRREIKFQEELDPLDERERGARKAIEDARHEMTAIARQEREEDKEERRLQDVAKALARHEERANLEHRRSNLLRLSKRQLKNQKALNVNKATAEAVESVNKAEHALAILTARLESAAARVAVDLGPSATGQVWIDEQPLSESIEMAAVGPLAIRVGDLATIRVSPSSNANETDQEESQRLQVQVLEILNNTRTASAEDLRAARGIRQELEAEARGIAAELLAFDATERSPTITMDGIRAEVEQINAFVSNTLTELELDVLPTSIEVTNQQNTLRENRELARRKRQAIEGSMEAQNKILQEIGNSRGQLLGTVNEITARLNENLAVLPDADRDRLITEAQKDFDKASSDHGMKALELEKRHTTSPSAEAIEDCRNRVARLKMAHDNHQSSLAALEREIANLEGQIESAGGDGVGEKVESLREQLDLATREVERHKERVATLELLKTTIESCYREQRDRLHAPLRRHLRPFLNDLFPSAELEMGDNFAITGLQRNGPNIEGLERLSDGTQEQIAVLVRLAMGAMICERGHETPIILDDALVFSDDDRIEQMFNALNRAGQTQQVIIFTCRTRTFATLGGRQLSIVTGDA